MYWNGRRLFENIIAHSMRLTIGTGLPSLYSFWSNLLSKTLCQTLHLNASDYPYDLPSEECRDQVS